MGSGVLRQEAAGGASNIGKQEGLTQGPERDCVFGERFSGTGIRIRDSLQGSQDLSLLGHSSLGSRCIGESVAVAEWGAEGSDKETHSLSRICPRVRRELFEGRGKRAPMGTTGACWTPALSGPARLTSAGGRSPVSRGLLDADVGRWDCACCELQS